MSLLSLNIAEFEPPEPKTPLVFECLRDLTDSDMALIESTPAGETPPELKRLTDRHHMLARLIAAGVKEEDAAFQTGYSLARVSILKNSPAFRELLAFYRENVDKQYTNVVEHMAGLSKDALVVLRDRIEEAPDRISTPELLKIITELRDRTATHDDADTPLPEVVELVAPETPSSLSDEGAASGEGPQ